MKDCNRVMFDALGNGKPIAELCNSQVMKTEMNVLHTQWRNRLAPALKA